MGEVPGAQVNLVTAAEAVLNQEPKESGEGWPAHWRAGAYADWRDIGGFLSVSRAYLRIYLICYYGLRLTVNYCMCLKLLITLSCTVKFF